MAGSLPSFRLDGRTAVVTGAGSGIGRAVALGLAESGARVGWVDMGSRATAGSTGTALATAHAIGEAGSPRWEAQPPAARWGPAQPDRY